MDTLTNTLSVIGLLLFMAAILERALAVAVRRCTMCPSLGKCEQFLAGERDDVDAFCPNTMFLDNLGRAKARR